MKTVDSVPSAELLGDYDAAADMHASIDFAYQFIRERRAAGGLGWVAPVLTEGRRYPGRRVPGAVA